MEKKISLITLGVSDLQRAFGFSTKMSSLGKRNRPRIKQKGVDVWHRCP